MSPQLTDDAVGKTVENGDSEEIGMVVSVEGDTAYVEPEPGLTDTIKATLGWGDESDDALPVPAADVARITDDAIRLEPATAETSSSAGPGSGTDDLEAGFGADRSEPDPETTSSGEETDPAAEMESAGEMESVDEMDGADDMDAAAEIDSVEAEASDELKVDPTELTNDDPEAEIRPGEDVGDRTDAGTETDVGAGEPDTSGGRSGGPTTEDAGETNVDLEPETAPLDESDAAEDDELAGAEERNRESDR